MSNANNSQSYLSRDFYANHTSNKNYTNNPDNENIYYAINGGRSLFNYHNRTSHITTGRFEEHYVDENSRSLTSQLSRIADSFNLYKNTKDEVAGPQAPIAPLKRTKSKKGKNVKGKKEEGEKSDNYNACGCVGSSECNCTGACDGGCDCAAHANNISKYIF
jgi:hypothetical protein